MTVPTFAAARTVCEARDWSISNLELQKILYIAHMLFLGKTNGKPLVNEAFEAWDYGPVLPTLYYRVKGFGADPVRNVFHWIPPVSPDNPEYATLQEVAKATREWSASRLVAITHRDDGAWAHFYRPGVRGNKIPNSAILEEYRKRERNIGQIAEQPG